MTDLSLMEREARESALRVAEQARLLSPAVDTICEALTPTLNLVVTCARGSSDHAALFAKYLIETRLGLPVASAAPSVTSVYGSDQKLAGALLLAISQSGQSPDILAFTGMAQQSGARVLAIVNTPDSPLARAADWVLPLGAGPERSVAATKSYICTLAAIVQLVAGCARSAELRRTLDRLPDLLDRSADLDPTPISKFMFDVEGCFLIGRGLGFAVAQEAALKLKETCGVHAEALSAAEVQHGPMALLSRGLPALFLVHDDRTADEQALLAGRFRAQGARVFVMGPARIAPDFSIADADDPVGSAIGLIQSFHVMAAGLARSRGLDPDRPPMLSKVTKTS